VADKVFGSGDRLSYDEDLTGADVLPSRSPEMEPDSIEPVRSLETLVGSAEIQPWAAIDPALQARIEAAIIPGHSVSGLVLPRTSAELAATIAEAHQQHQTVLPCGHGSKLNWGGLVKAPDWIVSTDRLNRLIDPCCRRFDRHRGSGHRVC
jgi:hypothetical protein